MTLGEFVRQERFRQGVTLREFCIRNCFDPAVLSRIERDEAWPSDLRVPGLKFLARALELDNDQCEEFYCLALEAAQGLPHEPTDAELVRRLPAFLPPDMDRANLPQLIEAIKNA